MRPEDQARRDIDGMLEESGWMVQDYSQRNLGASLGVAIREFPLGRDAADYALFIGRQPVGVVEAKKKGWTLIGVTEQSERYLAGLSEKFPNSPRRPVFSYETTGIETLFADRRDPHYRSRHVFTFHNPEILALWLRQEKPLRARLGDIPQLDYENLWDCQRQAVTNLEDSLRNNRPRALIQMATGSGKTFTAVTAIYRLLKFANAKRVLFLVDRGNLGRQALREFQQYATPDDGRKFTELYNVQHLQSQAIDPISSVVISTIQRMYSILKGTEEFDETSEEFSEFERSGDGALVVVRYNPNIPIGEFDFIIIDECHRSIYNDWKRVLDYFDSFLIGLTATPSKHTIGFFDNNQVMTYTHERAVADGVNVGYHVYRIKTRITEAGSIIDAGEAIEKRDKMTRQRRFEQLDEDLIYTGDQLDRDVLAPDQIRTIMVTFKKKLAEIFPERVEDVPKTLIFAKDDNHAEAITEITREVFDRGNEFCQKITYRTTGERPENILASFRNSPNPRIAVTVDMIATGTDIRALECIILMRDVKSKTYFDQMKGRGTRTILPADLARITPGAKAKDHFVVVDAVGVCEHAMSDTHSMRRKKGVSFESLMEAAADGRATEEELESLAYRLARLDRRLDSREREEIEQASGGKAIPVLVNQILDGIDTDRQIEYAREKFGAEEPTKDQLKEAARECVSMACQLFDSARLRQTILDVKKRNEIIIDEISLDEVLEEGIDEQAAEMSRRAVNDFREFIEKNRDEIAALQIIYSKPYDIRELTFRDIKELADAIKKPPYSLTPERLWRAYQRLDKSKVRDNPKKMLTDLISIVRFTLGHELELIPFDAEIDERFKKWLADQESAGREFTQEQKKWLVMIKDHIATSITVTMDDIDNVPFLRYGGRIRLCNLFGDDYEKILSELHEVLISQ